MVDSITNYVYAKEIAEYKLLSKKSGHMSVDEALRYLQLKKKLKEWSSSNDSFMPQHVGDYDLKPLKGADRSAVLRTPGDIGSKYDKGYVIGIPLEQYRNESKKQEYDGYLDLAIKITIVIITTVVLVLLVRLIIRKWILIRKFFTG